MPAKHKPTTLHKSMNTKPPEPPADYAKRFQESTYFTYCEYLKARPYDKWSKPDLRVLCQICLLEDAIMEAQEEVALEGTTGVGSQGQKVANPALSALIKLQQQQGSMMRRMGIATRGIDSAKSTKRDAEFHRKMDAVGDEKGLLA